MLRYALALSAVAMLAACGNAGDDATTDTMSPESAEAGNVANAKLYDRDGQPAGEAILAAGEGGLMLNLTLEGLPPGEHGVHIHETGDCSADDFSSAGGHWNPAEAGHGLEDDDGHHMGDLPNVTVAEDGTASLEFMIENATLIGKENPLLDEDGAAFVVHEDADDGTTDPSGDSGSRIACGTFQIRQSVAQ